jgi:hypothetical protein
VTIVLKRFIDPDSQHQKKACVDVESEGLSLAKNSK